METKALYQLWLEKARDDKDLICELQSIAGNQDEIYDRFYRNLAFGTAGLRGVIGAGTNRMNIYNVRLATQGLANYLNKKCKDAAVAISYDSRIKSTLLHRKRRVCLPQMGSVHILQRSCSLHRCFPLPYASCTVRPGLWLPPATTQPLITAINVMGRTAAK